MKEISRLDSPWSRQTPLDPKVIMKTQGSLETHDRDIPEPGLGRLAPAPDFDRVNILHIRMSIQSFFVGIGILLARFSRTT